MNRTLLSLLIGGMFPRYVVEPGTGDAGAAAAAAAASAAAAAAASNTTTVTPADARTYLTDLGHKVDATVKDEDVVKQYTTVRAGAEKHHKAVEKQQQQQQGAVALKLPENSMLDQADIDRIATHAKEKGLDQKAAEALLKSEEEAAVRVNSKIVTKHVANVKQWQETIKADKELGGDNLATTQRVAQLAIEKFVNPELRTLLRDGGYGDHPSVVRMFVEIGKAMSEDKGLSGAKGAGAGDQKDPATKLYGGTTP